MQVIGCIRSCDRSLDFCRIVERSNISLASSPSSCSSSSFLSRLGANVASSSRDSLCRTLGLSMKSRNSSIRGLKFNVQCDALLDSINLQSVDRFAHLLELPRDFFTLAHICHVHLWLSIDNWLSYDIANSLNPFLYYPFVSALSLSITANSYFCCQQSRHNVQNLSYDMSVFTWLL